MKKTSPLNYTYAVGKIRALENFLIREAVFEEALEANLSEALRLFTEANLYSDELLHVKDSQHLETLLNQELINLKKLMHDLLLDKELFNLIELNSIKCVEHVLRTYQSEFLEDYLMHLIDMHNIKTFLRLYLLKEPRELLEEFLTCEGFIKKGTFLRLYSGDLVAFVTQLEYVHKRGRIIDYAIFLRDAIERLEKENSFIYLEKAINDLLIFVLKPAKYINFGPEPVLAYYFAKVNEMNLMRLVILGKLNKVPTDLIKERLNSVYA
jgi:V/A-type H+-transporting ATPase subunit C